MASVVQQVESAPDLLRRFVTTPHHATWEFGAVCAHVITNAEQVLECFPQSRPSGQEQHRPKLHIKIVVDQDLQSSTMTSPLAVDAGSVLWGGSHDVFFAVDRELLEIVIFVGSYQRDTFRELIMELVGEQGAAFSNVSPRNKTAF